MATELDDDLVPEVLALIDELGADATITAGTPSYSAATGDTTLLAPAVHAVKVTPPWPRKRGFSAADTQIDETAVCYLAAKGLTFTPEMGQVLELLVEDDSGAQVSGGTFQITRATPIMPGQKIAVWELQVEG